MTKSSLIYINNDKYSFVLIIHLEIMQLCLGDTAIVLQTQKIYKFITISFFVIDQTLASSIVTLHIRKKF